MTVSDWDRRELCPDGGCTGLIGREGTCKVCGRAAPHWGDERKRGTQDDPTDHELVPADDARDPIAPSAPAVLGDLGQWTTRTLCADGACVGVIGSDGRCKVCGKPGLAGASVDDDEYDDEYEDDEYDDDDDEDDEDDDDDDEELAEAAAELADVASPDEVASAGGMARSESESDDRALCSDGACIGVIGDNGTCNVCGKAAA